MQFDIEARSARLELRIMELEDTSRALVGVVRTMNDMLGQINEMMGHYADALGVMVLGLPSAVHRLPLWPVAARSCRPPGVATGEDPVGGNQGCAGYCCGARTDSTPTGPVQ
jgi:hypothetical protein